MARWVSGDSAGRLSFFDCSGGSRVVQPTIDNPNSRGSSSSSSSTYFRKLLSSQCSCLTFSGGWGGYDESEVTMGTSEGGIFAVRSQWPSVAAAAASAAAAAAARTQHTTADAANSPSGRSRSRSLYSGSDYFNFPQTMGEAEVLRCSSLPYCVLLVQMLGVHSPELRRLISFSESPEASFAAQYPGLFDGNCCRARGSSSSSSCCSCHTRSSDLFGSDRQLLAVDKGGNGVVLDWCGDLTTSSSSSTGVYEATELRGFSLREPICCCSSNSLLVQQLAVASATAASFLSVYDIEANAFCFYAHAPPAAGAAQTILRCSGSSSNTRLSGSTSCDGVQHAASEARSSRSCSSSVTRLPVYAEVASPFSRQSTQAAAAAAAAAANRDSRVQPHVCTSVSWLPRLGPSLLCGVTADALLLLYDTRASSFPVFLASTAATAERETQASGAVSAAAAAVGEGPRPLVFVGAQPGLVAAHDEMEAAVLPCCCSCCSCCSCKRQRKAPTSQEQQQNGEKQHEHKEEEQQGEQQGTQESFFEGHRGRLVLKPHATNRLKHSSSTSSSSSNSSGSAHGVDSVRPLLSTKLQHRITQDFAELAEAHCLHNKGPPGEAPKAGKDPKARRKSGSGMERDKNRAGYAAPHAAVDAHVWSSAYSAADVIKATAGSERSNNSQSSRHSRCGGISHREGGVETLGRTDCWEAALVAVSSTADSPLTLFPAVPPPASSSCCCREEQQQQRQMQQGPPPVVLGWLATACYSLVASSLSLLLTEKHIVRRHLLQHAQQQILLLLRSSCLPPEALQPNTGSSTSSNHCSSAEPFASAAILARPTKKARTKSTALAAVASSASTDFATTDTTPVAAAAAAAPADPAVQKQHALQRFADRVLGLLRVLDPTESSALRQQHVQQVQQQLPALLRRQQQNVLRLLEYCAAFAFCFSQVSLRSAYPAIKAHYSKHSAAAAAAAAMQQAELPELLTQQATKEVLRLFRRAARLHSVAPATDAASAVAASVVSGARRFVRRLAMGFGFSTASQQPHLLISVLLCWLQQHQPLPRQVLPPVKGEDSIQGETGEDEKKQNFDCVTAAVTVPEVYIQRNCICRLPISDALYFGIAREQSRGGSRSSSRSSSSKSSYASRDYHSNSSSSAGPAADTAQLICCDTAGEVSVLRVSLRRFKSQKEKHIYLNRPQTQNSRRNEQQDDALAKASIWFPQLPALNPEVEAAAAAAAADEAAVNSSSTGPQFSVGGACSCRCCSTVYSVRLEVNFVAPRSSSSSSSLSVHSNGSYLLLASRDPYFALYGVNPNLPPYGGRSKSGVTPLLGLALPPGAAAAVQQQQHAAAEVVQPILLSAAPLLPSVPLPTSLPPYLAAPPIPPTQVSLQRRFQQMVLQGQHASAAAATTHLGGAAWDTGIEFSDWLSEPEDPDWQAD